MVIGDVAPMIWIMYIIYIYISIYIYIYIDGIFHTPIQTVELPELPAYSTGPLQS
jgi:hypothetical protein